jgi:nucleoside-diphosphate-sugar epimerase
MKVLVTGATGFIGSALVKQLAVQGDDVSVLVRGTSDTKALASFLGSDRICLYDGSLGSIIAALKTAQPDLVFHVASLFLAQHKPEDVDRLIASNILFPAQLLEAMNGLALRRLINVGTSWQHYEDKAYSPVNLYAGTKQAFEDLLQFYAEAHNFAVITLGLFDTYGPGDARPKLFSLLRKLARHGNTLKMSPGEQLIDLVYIDDVIDAFLIAGRRVTQITDSERYGLSSGNPIALRELVRIYGQIVGKSLEIEWGGLPYRPRETMVPWKSYRILPGWQPKTLLEQGIAQMERDPSIEGLLSSAQ